MEKDNFVRFNYLCANDNDGWWRRDLKLIDIWECPTSDKALEITATTYDFVESSQLCSSSLTLSPA